MASNADTEDDIRRARDLLQDAIESLSEGFALYDDDRRLVMCNARYKEMNSAVADILEPGLDWEILMRETARRGVYSDAIGREDAWVRDRLETTHDYVDEYELQHTDGTVYLVSTHPTKLGGFVVTRTDITEKRQAEAQERDGDLMVRTVLDASSAIVVMARTGDGEILYRSPAALKKYGNTKFAREHYVNAEDRADYVTQLLADGQVDDYRINQVAKGQVFPASASARFAEYRGEEVVVSNVIDLTTQLKAQELIKQVLEACPIPIQMTHAETGEVLFRSPETAALFGVASKAHSYYADASKREIFLEKIRQTGTVIEHKTRYINAKGEEFWGAVSAQLIEFHGEDVIVSNTRDLTQELALQEELETQRDMLFQNEKMSALGELLAGVAHELNNPLSIVVGHSLMLKEEVADPEILRRIEKISNAAERSAKIVKTFLAMARQRPVKMEHVDVSSVISTAIDVAAYGHNQDELQITADLPKSLPAILADPDQITQVVINLVINASHAISNSETGDRIEVSAALHKDQDKVEIFIIDNGPGIPENIQARIFEPFFTTKEIGDGTGIGLAFCHRIIHSHGGHIKLDDNVTGGSRFCITLPIAEGKEAQAGSETAAIQTEKTRRALIVDDEIDVAELIAEILRKDGFEVSMAHTGAAALDILKGEGFDILLSDLNMPEMNGQGLFDVVKTKYPDLVARTGFITGDTMGEASQSMLQATQRPYLEKPVSPDEVRTLVYGILNDVKDTS